MAAKRLNAFLTTVNILSWYKIPSWIIRYIKNSYVIWVVNLLNKNTCCVNIHILDVINMKLARVFKVAEGWCFCDVAVLK